MESLRGKLLIASPALVDPNFLRTVILIAEHTDEGAMGLVLNRPAESPSARPSRPLLARRRGRARVLRRARRRDRVIVLAEFDARTLAGALLDGDLGFVGSDAETGDVDGAIRRARVFAGHAGWGPGQLEDELAEEAWIIEPPRREEIFSEDSDEPVGGGAAAQGPAVRAALDDAAGSVGQLIGTGCRTPHRRGCPVVRVGR